MYASSLQVYHFQTGQGKVKSEFGNTIVSAIATWHICLKSQT